MLHFRCANLNELQVPAHLQHAQADCMHAWTSTQSPATGRSCQSLWPTRYLSRHSSRLPLRQLWRCRAAPTYNPQNVPDPQVMPSPEFSAEEAVKAQLDALKDCHSPWTNHGIQTMYEFGLDIGGMERSRYFGMSKDLYHFDHFLGQFQNSFPDLFNMTSYSIAGVDEDGEETNITVEGQTKQGKTFTLLFKMAKRDFGKKKGSIMTKSLLKQ